MHITLQVDVVSISLWAVVATAALTTITNLSQWQGLSRMSLPFMLGTAFSGNRDHAQIIGFICHFVLGWIFALPYALIFQSWQWATWWLGAGVGFLHGVFILAAIMPLLPHIHPRMSNEHDGPTPTRMLEPPGFMALNYGRRTPLIMLLAHLVYGGILGAFYKVSGG